MAGERKLQAILEWSIKEGSLDKTIKALAPLKKELGEIDKLIDAISKKLNNLGTSSKKVSINIDKKAVTDFEASVEKSGQAVDNISAKAKGVTENLTGAAQAAEKLSSALAVVAKIQGELTNGPALKLNPTEINQGRYNPNQLQAGQQTPQLQSGIIETTWRDVTSEVNAAKQAEGEFAREAFRAYEAKKQTAYEAARVNKEVAQTAADESKVANETSNLKDDFKEAAVAAEQVAQATESIAQATAKAAEAPKKYVSDTIYSSSLFDTKLAHVGLTDEQKTQLYEIRKQTPNAYNDAAGTKEYINKVANILTDVQRKQIGIREETEKTASAYQKVAESAKETAAEAQKTSEYQPQFEAIPGKQTGSANFFGEVKSPLSEMNPQVRDEYLSALSEAEQAALGYRKVVDQVASSSEKAAASQNEFAQSVNKVSEATQNASGKSKKFSKDYSTNVETAAASNDKLIAKVDESAAAIDDLSTKTSRIGAGMKYGIAGFTTQIIGVQIEQFVKPFYELPGKFAEFAGSSNEAARSWLNTTSRVEQAQMRIAQTVAQALLPAFESLADFIEKVAAIAEANPQWVQTLAKGAETLLIAATALKGIGFALSSYGAIKNLGSLIPGGAAGAGAALFGGGTAAAGGLAAGGTAAILPLLYAMLPVVLAAVATYAFKNISLGSMGVKGHDPGVSILDEASESLKKLASIAFGFFAGLGNIIDNLIHFRSPLEGVATTVAIATNAAYEYMNALKDQADAQKDIIVPEDIQKGIANLIQQLTDLEASYYEDRQKIIDDYGQRMVDTESKYSEQAQSIRDDAAGQLADLYADYLAQVADATEAYAKDSRRAEEDYYRKRLQRAADFGTEIERMEQDHQDKLEKMRRDHLFNVENLVASRDALGLAREMRRYEEERAQEEANYNKDVKRKNEDFAEELRRMDEEYAIERARRQEDFEDRLRQLEENYNRQKAKIAEQEAERLRQLEEQQKKETEMMGDNLEEQLKLLDERYAKEKENIQKQIAEQIALAESLGLTAQNIQLIYDTAVEYFTRLNQLKTQILSGLDFRGYGSGIPSGATSTGGGNTGRNTTVYFANGGYVHQAGLYGMAEGNQKEFVLSNKTVMGLEKQVGGLTQEKLLGLTTPRYVSSGTGRVVVEQNNWHIEGALTVSEKRALMGEVRAVTYEAIKNAR